MEALLGITGVLAAILGLVLAFYAVFVNGRANKEILREIQKGTVEIQKGTVEIQKGTVEIQKSAERQAQILERIEETQRHIAELVRMEGEKTRSLISR